MQKQLRNIFFAKKKDNIYKDFNVKVSINYTSVQIDEIFCEELLPLNHENAF